VSDRDERASGFVADGCERARRALEPAIRAEVEQEFAAELRQAPFWRRYWVRRKIQGEIERRIAAAAPPDALY
jgi:hypothetical protein